ncbi:MAG: hypothetical protein KDE53_39605, partial [Caldilineaceae bacterium]|nr:hypothetical protein [Caldilineaceae bacterium]
PEDAPAAPTTPKVPEFPTPPPHLRSEQLVESSPSASTPADATPPLGMEPPPEEPDTFNALQSSLTQIEQAGQTLFGPQINVLGNINYGVTASNLPLQRRVIRHEFVGRVDKLQELLERLQPGKTITICGPGGIGKSSLAAKAVWTLAPADQPPERFPDGIITHSFLERPEAATAFELIASAYKEVPQPDWATAAQRAMANRRALLVLDDAEAAQDLPSLLNRTGLCGVLITTRRREDAPDQNAVMDLPPLAPEEATTLLKKLAGARALDEDAVAQICHLVGYLPFSINFVGRYLHSYGINATEYLSSLELNDEADQTIDERQRAGIAHLFNRTITYISDLARQTLGVIGVLAQAPFEHSLIESVLEIKSAYHTLGELVNYSFLERGDTSYKVAHALIRTYA